MKKVTVNNREYNQVHGRSPKGYGLWMFSFTVNGFTRTCQITANYSNAKEYAQKYAQEFGASTVEVMS